MISTFKCCLVVLTIFVVNFGDSKEIINNEPQLSEKRKFINISLLFKPSILSYPMGKILIMILIPAF